ncbi:uncharacterized protein LOC131187516 [Ahaetulla prasina]|uniref:uncharacterized protein LOC131187516 n=1 Tax=Ahaetulla prasina TaxID=499056 RepID=UPI0026481E30|nr:uncharacterized protein LOC131187516 [Ahaetulla prasina]
MPMISEPPQRPCFFPEARRKGKRGVRWALSGIRLPVSTTGKEALQNSTCDACRSSGCRVALPELRFSLFASSPQDTGSSAARKSGRRISSTGRKGQGRRRGWQAGAEESARAWPRPLLVLRGARGNHLWEGRAGRQHQLGKLKDVYEAAQNRECVNLKEAVLEMVERLKCKDPKTHVFVEKLRLCRTEEVWPNLQLSLWPIRRISPMLGLSCSAHRKNVQVPKTVLVFRRGENANNS